MVCLVFQENETEPMTAKSNEMELSEQLHASLLDLPEVPDLDAEKEEVDGEISVETPASANLSYSYKDAREVLIPGTVTLITPMVKVHHFFLPNGLNRSPF